MGKTHKHYEAVAVDIFYRDVNKEPLTVAVIPRDASIKDWLDEHIPIHKMPPDAAMIFTYNVILN